MARKTREEVFSELARFLREVMKVRDEFVSAIEELAVKPVLKPVDDVVKSIVLKEYIYGFREPILPEREILELEIKRLMGIEGDIEEYLKGFFEGASSASGERGEQGRPSPDRGGGEDGQAEAG
ncbi:MAG: hypothetical protein F7C34_05210 [Desulfurococcales archaeon]|nr:hypothetical protein [Desulfurococcales archaeon]